jgi:hypothetical protein
MLSAKSYYVDNRHRCIAGLDESVLIKRIKMYKFKEVNYTHRNNWRLFINDGPEMIWLKN